MKKNYIIIRALIKNIPYTTDEYTWIGNSFHKRNSTLIIFAFSLDFNKIYAQTCLITINRVLVPKKNILEF